MPSVLVCRRRALKCSLFPLLLFVRVSAQKADLPLPPPSPAPPRPSPAPPRACLCLNTCHYANDDDCDDGGAGAEYASCPLGSDCNDCGGACPPSPPMLPLPPLIPGCEAPLDVVLIVDASGSIWPYQEELRAFGRNVLDQFELGIQAAQFSLVTFSSRCKRSRTPHGPLSCSLQLHGCLASTLSAARWVRTNLSPNPRLHALAALTSASLSRRTVVRYLRASTTSPLAAPRASLAA